MYSMNYDITIGKYRLAALEKVAIKCSVENLADMADITLPGTLFNRTLHLIATLSSAANRYLPIVMS